MGDYKLGKLPATRLAGVGMLAEYAAGKLPKPPASVMPPAAAYPIDGNDRFGDCTIAGVAHLIAAWNVETRESDKVPSGAEVVSTYFKLTGNLDSGLNEADVLEHWRTQGLFGEKIAAYAPVNQTSILDLHSAIAFYGGVYLGIACPQSAQQQFEDGQVWTYIPGSPIEGGHCIVGLGYNSNFLYCATWGGIAKVTYQFMAHFFDEAWAVIPHEFVESGKDSAGIDLAALTADLDALR